MYCSHTFKFDYVSLAVYKRKLTIIVLYVKVSSSMNIRLCRSNNMVLCNSVSGQLESFLLMLIRCTSMFSFEVFAARECHVFLMNFLQMAVGTLLATKTQYT